MWNLAKLKLRPVFWLLHCENWGQLLLIYINSVYKYISMCMYHSSMI